MAERLTPSEAFAKSVKRARQLQGWNQQQLANQLTAVGVPTQQSTVARVETGKRGISLDDAVAYSVALNVPLARLIAGQAVEESLIALAPRKVFPAELSRRHLVGDFHLAPEPGQSDLYGWWKGSGEERGEEEFFAAAERAGLLRVEPDGTRWVDDGLGESDGPR